VKRAVKKSAFETKTWTYNAVVTAMHRQEIIDMAVRLSGSRAGTPLFLKSYKQARALIEKDFPDGQRQRYKAMAKEWSEKPLPSQLQQEYVHRNNSSLLYLTDSLSLSMMTKSGTKAVKEFSSAAYNQFGMRVVVLAAFVNEKNEPLVSLWVPCSILFMHASRNFN
jgi:hypothetical protein